LCGAVRIEVTAEPYRVGICHCLDCRKRQGSALHFFAVFPASAAKVTGETREYRTRSFCPTCGSPLFDLFGDEFELHAGCLDAPDQLKPTYECWVIRRESWLPAIDLAHHYARDRT
jgi:hypothetical protein